MTDATRERKTDKQVLEYLERARKVVISIDDNLDNAISEQMGSVEKTLLFTVEIAKMIQLEERSK